MGVVEAGPLTILCKNRSWYNLVPMVSRLPAGSTETGNEVEFDSEIITKTCFFANFYAANRKKSNLNVFSPPSLKNPTLAMILSMKWFTCYLFNIAKKRKWNNVVNKVCFKLQDPWSKLNNWRVKKFKLEAKQVIVNEMNFNKLSVTYW